MRHLPTAIKNNDAEEYLMKRKMFMIFFFKKQPTSHWAERDPICVTEYKARTEN